MEDIDETTMLIYLIFEHPTSKKQLVSKGYTPSELIEKYDETLQEETCHCDCSPIGETNVIECSCDDYYQYFELVKTVIK